MKLDRIEITDHWSKGKGRSVELSVEEEVPLTLVGEIENCKGVTLLGAVHHCLFGGEMDDLFYEPGEEAPTGPDFEVVTTGTCPGVETYEQRDEGTVELPLKLTFTFDGRTLTFERSHTMVMPYISSIPQRSEEGLWAIRISSGMETTSYIGYDGMDEVPAHFREKVLGPFPELSFAFAPAWVPPPAWTIDVLSSIHHDAEGTDDLRKEVLARARTVLTDLGENEDTFLSFLEAQGGKDIDDLMDLDPKELNRSSVALAVALIASRPLAPVFVSTSSMRLVNDLFRDGRSRSVTDDPLLKSLRRAVPKSQIIVFGPPKDIWDLERCSKGIRNSIRTVYMGPTVPEALLRSGRGSSVERSDEEGMTENRLASWKASKILSGLLKENGATEEQIATVLDGLQGMNASLLSYDDIRRAVGRVRWPFPVRDMGTAMASAYRRSQLYEEYAERLNSVVEAAEIYWFVRRPTGGRRRRCMKKR